MSTGDKLWTKGRGNSLKLT